MSQITKTLESKVGSIGVSADGTSVSVSLAWSEKTSDPRRTSTVVPIRITKGQTFRVSADLGAAPPEILELAKRLSVAVTTYVNNLASQKLLDP